MMEDLKKVLNVIGSIGGMAVLLKKALDTIETKDYIDIETVKIPMDKIKKE